MIMWTAAAALALLMAAVPASASGPAAAPRAGTSFATPTTASAATAWPALVITGEHTPPSSMMVDGKPVGYQTDKMHLLLQRAGVPYRIEILPWKRAYVMAVRDPLTCVYSTSRTPEREALFKWVGPINRTEWLLLGRAGHKFQLRTLEDARHLRIGSYTGDARGEYLRSRGFNVDATLNDMSNQQKLLLNRIDLWAIATRADSNILEKLSLNGKIVPVLVFNKVELYLACNPSVPDALVEYLNTVFEGMRADGSLTRIDRQYDHLRPKK